ncbi:hypothetical protein GIB67_024219 [Kingdonia uniflora]|uniref:Uncharacterized protein n=1 Tax=Kingdonia uniflora TaxID=39325 RepID=A0A7J7LZR2_9MAGN|nr:hypothetical protein GIB67_024219 [Kingdonia uniflora]
MYSLKFPRIEESIHLSPKLQGWRMTSFKRHQIVTFKKFLANPKLLRNHIETPALGGAPTIGSNSTTTAIRAVVVRVSYQLEEHGKMLLKLDDHENLHQQVAPGKGLEVVKDFMIDDDVEVGMEVNLEAILSEYGDGLLEWKKGDKKDDEDEKDVEEKVKSAEEERPQVAKEEEVQETMVAAEVTKIDIVFFNQEEVVGEAYQTKESKKEVEQSKEKEDVDEASQTKESKEEVGQSKEEVKQSKEEVVEGKDDDDGNSQKKPDPVQVIKEMVVDQTNLVLMESEVDAFLKKMHALTNAEINERAFKMACQINQLHAHLDELFLGVLLKSFIQRPISHDEKNQVDQVWSLRKDKLSPEAKKDNINTYRRIGQETVCLNALYTLYPKKWLDNEVIDVYSKALIQYFDTQYRARLDKEKLC